MCLALVIFVCLKKPMIMAMDMDNTSGYGNLSDLYPQLVMIYMDKSPAIFANAQINKFVNITTKNRQVNHSSTARVIRWQNIDARAAPFCHASENSAVFLLYFII